MDAYHIDDHWTVLGKRARQPAVAIALGGGLAVACQADSHGSDEAEALADVLCSTYFECDCPGLARDPMYTIEEQCRSAVESRYEDWIDEGAAASLQLDYVCFQRFLAFASSFECLVMSHQPSDRPLEAYELGQCKWFLGDDQVGQPCTALENSAGDSCVKGLHCEHGTCVQDVLLPGPGESCNETGLCARGALCLDLDGDTVNVCERVLEAGRSCPQPQSVCRESHACDPETMTCAIVNVDPGSPCESGTILNQCGVGQLCDPSSNTCQRFPWNGEACIADQCAIGFACEGDVCVEEIPAVCHGFELPGLL